MNLVNPELNLPLLRQEFLDTGRVFVRNYLESSIAEKIYQHLETDVPWSYVSFAGEGITDLHHSKLNALSPEEQNQLIPKPPQNSVEKFCYAFNRFDVKPGGEQEQSEFKLIQMLGALNQPGYINQLKAITGFEQGHNVDCSASRYLPGHHLTAHTDFVPGQGHKRLAAHVLGLTKEWSDDWGGKLTFCDGQGNTFEQRTPSFNTLALFKVPRVHYVSAVNPEATTRRYSLFGWLKRA